MANQEGADDRSESSEGTITSRTVGVRSSANIVRLDVGNGSLPAEEDPLDFTYFTGVAPKYGSTKCLILQLRDMANPYQGLPFLITHCHAEFRTHPEACLLNERTHAVRVSVITPERLSPELAGIQNLYSITFRHGAFEWRVTRTWRRKDVVNLLGMVGIPVLYNLRQRTQRIQQHQQHYQQLAQQPQQQELLLQLLASASVSAAPTVPRGVIEGRSWAAQRRLLTRWMSVWPSRIGGGLWAFTGRLASPPAACAGVATPSDSDSAWNVRVRTANVSISNDDAWSQSLQAQSFDIAVAPTAAVLTPGQAPGDSLGSAKGPTVYISERFGAAYSVDRIWPLGLQYCERLDQDVSQASFRNFRSWKTPEQLLAKPERFSAVLHHGYCQGWQMWLRSEPNGDLEALVVRVQHKATGACSVERRWLLAQSPNDADRVVVTLQEFQHNLPSNSEVFRVPAVCHRVEL